MLAPAKRMTSCSPSTPVAQLRVNASSLAAGLRSGLTYEGGPSSYVDRLAMLRPRRCRTAGQSELLVGRAARPERLRTTVGVPVAARRSAYGLKERLL